MRWRRAQRIHILASVLLAGLPLIAAGPRYLIDTIAGTDSVGDGGPALEAQLSNAEGLATQGSRYLWVVDNTNHRLRRVDLWNGIIETVAGNGLAGFAGDDGPAGQAQLSQPYGVTVDGAGNVFVADFGNARVRRVDPAGLITTVAGGGQKTGKSGGNALAARLGGPRNVAIDKNGNLYFSDFTGHFVYQVSPHRMISIVAGTGVAGYNGEGAAVAAQLDSPAGLAAAPNGALYVADSGNHRVRRIEGGGIVTVMGGEGDAIQLERPTGIAVDRNGTLYVADPGHRRIVRRGWAGDTTIIPFELPDGASIREVAVGPSGTLYAAGGGRVFAIDGEGRARAIAGRGPSNGPGDGIQAVQASLQGPIGVAVSPGGEIYVAEEGGHRVRQVDLAGVIRTVAGSGERGYGGDGGPATEARLVDPVAALPDSLGRLWIADHAGNRIRRVEANGSIVTVTGNGTPGFDAFSNAADEALVNRPRGLAIDRRGTVYFADSLNHRIRCINAGGLITTFAGSGVRGYAGDAGLAIMAQLDTPAGVAFDDENEALYVADAGNNAIRKISREGFIFTVAGTGAQGFGGDGGPAEEAALNQPAGVALGDGGSVLIADTGNHRVRRIDAAGVIETVAGSGIPGFAGDGGVATAARLHFPTGLAVDKSGAVLVADLDNRRIRRLTPVWAPPVTEPTPVCQVVNAASYAAGPVAPGELVSIFGDGIGPATPAYARYSAAGALESVLSGTRVRFASAEAPLVFAEGGQVNAQAPYSIAGAAEVRMELYAGGELRCVADLAVAAAAPGVFTLNGGAGQAIVVNEDGTLNGGGNPAPRGSVITFYATGEGLTDPASASGEPARPPWPKPVLPVAVRLGGLPAEILYAGRAPGFVGLMQINVGVPSGFVPTGNLTLELFVGGAGSQRGVTVAVK